MSRRSPPLCFSAALVTWLLAVGLGVARAQTSQPASQPASAPAASRPTKAVKLAAEAGDPYAGLDDQGTPALPPRQVELSPSPRFGDGGQRPLPRYTGREPAGLSAGEALIWIPRGLFYPLHLLLNYGVRWPIVKAITLAEEHHAIDRVKRLFTFNAGRGALYPTLFFDFGRNPSVGMRFSYRGLFAEGDAFALGAGYWPNGWYHFTLSDRLTAFRDDGGEILLKSQFVSRPDYLFYGLGPSSAQNTERFFRLRLVDLSAGLRARLKDLNRVSFTASYRNAEITDGKSPGLGAADSPHAVGDRAAVPGYGESYNLLAAQLRVELDSRSPDRVFTPGSGLRLELFGSFSVDPTAADLRFFRWGGTISGFWDLSGINHVLALSFYAEAIERVGDGVLPISERVSLGGDTFLRGFLEGRFRGDSAMVLRLNYRYPIWTFLDANLFTSLGNVFIGRFQRLHLKRMVMSWGIGLRTNTSRDVSFDILVGFGSNQLTRWSEDFAVDNIRVFIGVSQGF